MADLDRDEMDEEFDRREFRRKRRIRNQIISYIVTGIILAAVVVGAIVGIRKAGVVLSEKKCSEEQQMQADENEDQQEEPAVVEAPENTPQIGEEKSRLDMIVDDCIAGMTLEDKAAGLFIITPEAPTGVDIAIKAGDTTKEKLSEYALGGLVYFEQNIKSKDQLTEMLSTTKGSGKYPLFIAVDEEGGTVSRVAESGLADNVGSMGDIGASGDTAKAKEAGSAVAAYLSEFGFNLNFAPVADVLLENNAIIGDRSFGSDAQGAGAMAAANVEGLQEGGVSACLKHFPGLGSASEDTHDGMVVSERTQEEFEANEFTAFRAGIEAGAEFVMVSHLSVPGITGDNTPSSVSGKVISDLLRGELGFDGIVITDAMDMSAITDYYTADEAAVMALQAGADMILMPEDFETAYNGVLEAVNSGRLSEERIDESLRRIFRVKMKDRAEE